MKVRTCLSAPAFLLLFAVAVAAPSARENYKTHCTSCHGSDGKGQTRLGKKSGAKDLSDKVDWLEYGRRAKVDFLIVGEIEALGYEAPEFVGMFQGRVRARYEVWNIRAGDRGYVRQVEVRVPEDPEAYSQQQAADDIKGVLDHLEIAKAHVCGLSMGGYATLHFGLCYPERALSLVVAGAGYGSDDPDSHRRDSAIVIGRFETEGMEKTGEDYAHGPTRVQYLEKDPLGWKDFRDRLMSGSARGHALTMRGVQMKRPTIYSLEARLTQLEVPTLIVTGDEDEPCLEPGIFMKRRIPASGLVVLPKTGHAANLEEPDAFNRAVLDFLTAVDAGRWTRRRADSIAKSGILRVSP